MEVIKTRFESAQVGFWDEELISILEQDILFNANFSANVDCPYCFQPKRKEQRESWLMYNGIEYLFHVWLNVATHKYIIRDCIREGLDGKPALKRELP